MNNMNNKFGKSSIGVVLLVLFFVLIVSIFVVNNFMSKKLKSIQDNESVRVVKPVVVENKAVVHYLGKITRKTRWDPSRKFAQSIFYVKDKEIARYKSSYDNVYDFTGNIPDGRVKIIDETRNTTGEEYYRDNKRHGLSKEYYSSGKLKSEVKYIRGKVLTKKLYYIDGTLKQEEDLMDAMLITNNKEVGAGKVYRRDGTLMYEWRLTNSDRGGYNKSYNSLGKLVAENFFDENGELIEGE